MASTQRMYCGWPTLVRRLIGEGRTVFLSSHLMTEMALTADHIVVTGRGRILADAPVADVIARATDTRVRVRTPEATTVAELPRRPDVTVTSPEPHCVIEVTGSTSPAIGGAAFAPGITMRELTPLHGSLEDAYMEITAETRSSARRLFRWTRSRNPSPGAGAVEEGALR